VGVAKRGKSGRLSFEAAALDERDDEQRQNARDNIVQTSSEAPRARPPPKRRKKDRRPPSRSTSAPRPPARS